MKRLWLAFWKHRMFDECWAERDRLMLEVRQLRHDLIETRKDRDLVGQVGLRRLAECREVLAEVAHLRAAVDEMKEDIRFYRSMAEAMRVD